MKNIIKYFLEIEYMLFVFIKLRGLLFNCYVNIVIIVYCSKRKNIMLSISGFF